MSGEPGQSGAGPDGATRKVLILFAHPAIGRSEANRVMFEAAGKLPGVTAIDLYGEYPTYDIDIDREQQRLLDHDVVVFQYPFYWYSTPSLLKEWQDLVLEYGFAYGESGNRLSGKIFLSALTAAGAEADYQNDGSNLFSLRELLQPLEQTANLCGMIYLPPFVLFRSRSARQEGRIEPHVRQWLDLLQALRDDKIDIRACQPLALLNSWSATGTGAN